MPNCETGKIGYKTRPAAERALSSMSKRQHTHAGTTYLCPFCGEYHFTRKSGHKKHAERTRALAKEFERDDF